MFFRVYLKVRHVLVCTPGLVFSYLVFYLVIFFYKYLLSKCSVECTVFPQASVREKMRQNYPPRSCLHSRAFPAEKCAENYESKNAEGGGDCLAYCAFCQLEKTDMMLRLVEYFILDLLW